MEGPSRAGGEEGQERKREEERGKVKKARI
jgi:hypothetical protein